MLTILEPTIIQLVLTVASGSLSPSRRSAVGRSQDTEVAWAQDLQTVVGSA